MNDGLDEAVEEIFLDGMDDISMTPGATGDAAVVEEGIDDSL